MQQLWSEVFELTQHGEGWQLEADEKAHIKRINESHMQIDPIEEMIVTMFYSEIVTASIWLTATEIAQKIGIKNVSQKETRMIAGIIRKFNNNDKAKEKTSSGLKFCVPAPRI